MDKATLPFEIDTYVNQYLDQSYPYGIIQANAKINNIDIMPWIASKFINYSFNQSIDKNQFSVQIFDANGINDGKLTQDIVNLDRTEYLSNNATPLINYIIDLIRSGHYVLGQFNEKYVAQMSIYQKMDFIHTYILYGFDSSSSQFKSAGYVNGHKYQEYNLSFDDYYNAIKYNNEKHITLRVTKYNKDKKYILNYNRLVQAFKDYYHSENNISFCYPPKQVHGLDALNLLGEYYLNLKTGQAFDIRFTIGVAKTKSLLIDILKYLQNYFLLQDFEDIIESAKEVAKKAYFTHLMGVKYNYTFNRSILESVYSNIMSIIEIEKITFPKIINKLTAITDFPSGTYLGPLDKL